MGGASHLHFVTCLRHVLIFTNSCHLIAAATVGRRCAADHLCKVQKLKRIIDLAERHTTIAFRNEFM